jgi:hypothetical protein
MSPVQAFLDSGLSMVTVAMWPSPSTLIAGWYRGGELLIGR